MGSIDTAPSLKTYSVPSEAINVLQSGILSNTKIAKNLPQGTSDFAAKIKFTGNDLPSIPINWRFAESAAALKGLEACLVAQLVKRKYGVDIDSATINTDHASLFFMSTALWNVVGKPAIYDTAHEQTGIVDVAAVKELIPNYDFYSKHTSYGSLVTNIYETKDGRWFHLHGSLNPEPSLKSIGLPLEPEDDELNTNWQKARQVFVDRMKTIDSDEMQHLASDVYKQAGVISNSVSQFYKSDHGKANEHVGLFEIHDVSSGHKPCWWPSTPQTSAQRPLAGLKVVDLTRIIAAPAVTRGLAELGASIMRVTSPNLPDFSTLHIDLNWGKWNTSLDLKDPSQLAQLKNLILDADVVVQGYRPGALDKYGLSQTDIIDLVRDRERGGIISVRENCYGWNGPWTYRSGWQQISDACVGISHRFGQAMGLQNDEAVTPVFPNSDYMTGIAGVCAILTALIRRGEKGGSYKLDIALNYYNQWLAESCGEYPEDVWEDVWSRNGRKVFRAYDNMAVTIPQYVDMIKEQSQDILFNPEFFEERRSDALETTFNCVKPIIRFEKGEVSLGYNVGNRGNGLDAPRWPEDLMTSVVTA